LKGSFPGDWEKKTAEDFSEYLRRTEQILVSIPWDRLVRFPIADGQALYYVKSVSPPVLQHIPYGDAYQIPAAHIRGLTTKDIRSMIRAEQQMAALFGERR